GPGGGVGSLGPCSTRRSIPPTGRHSYGTPTCSMGASTARRRLKPDGAAGPVVRGSPHGDGPGATGTERGRAGDADRLAGASPGYPDLEVRGPDCRATPPARRPAVHPVATGIGPAHGRGGARLVPAGVPRRGRARSVRQVRR